MSKVTHIILFLLISILFLLFQRNEMVGMIEYKLFGEAVSVSPLAKYVQLPLFVLCLIYLMMHRPPRQYFSKTYFFLIVYISFISLYWSTLRNSLLFNMMFSTTLLLPLVLFSYSYNITLKLNFFWILFSYSIGYVLLFMSYLDTYQLQIIYSINGDDARVSTAYIFMYLLPIFLLTKNNSFRFFISIITLLIVISSLKRGGIIATVIGLFFFCLVHIYSNNKKLSVPKVFFVVFLIVVGGILLFAKGGDRITLLFERIGEMGEDGGSGRTTVYEVTWQMISNSDLGSWLFGHGWNTVVENSPMELSAHNDFLEIWYDCGFIALCIYVFLLYKIIQSTLRMIKAKSPYAASMALSLVIFFISSMTAHIIIYPSYSTAFAVVWGAILAKAKQTTVYNLQRV